MKYLFQRAVMKQSLFLTAVLLMPGVGCAMTFEELSERAYEYSLQKSENDAKRQSLLYEKEAAAAYEPAVVEGTTRRIRADEPVNDGTEYGLMVGFTAKNPWMNEARNMAYDAAVKTVSGSAALDRSMLKVELKRDYLLNVLAKETAEIYRNKMETAANASAGAAKKESAGRLSKMERVRYETEANLAQKEYAASQVAYQRLQGRLRDRTLVNGEIVVDDLGFRYLKTGNTDDYLLRSPLMALYDARAEELSRQIETLRHSAIETVTVGIGTTQEVTQNSVDLKVSVPILFSNRNEKKIAALMTQRSAIVHQKALVKEKLEATVRHSFDRLGSIETMIGNAEKSERDYEQLYRMAEKGFEGGIVGLFEYLDTKNRFYQAKIDTIALKQEYVEEAAQMEEKLGGTWE